MSRVALVPNLLLFVQVSSASTLSDVAHRIPCLGSNQTQNPKKLIYPNGSSQPVRVPYGHWASARVSGEVAYILLSEVMQYETLLVDTNTTDDKRIVNFVSGCFDPDDSNCAQKELQNPAVHFTIESWKDGTLRAALLPGDVRPILINVQSFTLRDQYFLWQSVVDDGLNSSYDISLDFYRSYDASTHSPHIFFDSWERMFELLPAQVIVRCSDMDAQGSLYRDTQTYIRVTNDSNVSCSHDDRVWFSPACRAHPVRCVPLMVQYSIDVAMQLAYFHNMPLAIILVNSGDGGEYTEYYRAIYSGRREISNTLLHGSCPTLFCHRLQVCFEPSLPTPAPTIGLARSARARPPTCALAHACAAQVPLRLEDPRRQPRRLPRGPARHARLPPRGRRGSSGRDLPNRLHRYQPPQLRLAPGM